MTAVLFIVTIPTKEEEERLKKDYIARKLESKSLKSITTTGTLTNDVVESSGSVSGGEKKGDGFTITIEPSTPLTTGCSFMGRGIVPKRRKSESDNLEALGDQELIKLPDIQKSEGASLKSISSVQEIMPLSAGKSLEGLRDILSSSKSKIAKRMDSDLDLPFDECMEKVLKEILRKYEVQNDVWTKNLEGTLLQVTFTVEVDKVYETIVDKFQEWGIGDREGSSVTVLNCIAAKQFTKSEDSESDLETSREKLNLEKQSAWERFMNNVRCRLNIVQIVSNVRQDASITFDFCVLVICAAILAAFGLTDDSTIFLAASMLISPLMGPIIAAIFGTVIKDSSLRLLGMKNEVFGLLLATLVGFIFGLIACTLDGRYSIGEGMSTEMLSRCDKHSLLVGVFTAIPSGAAAAVGILGGNIGSLVGVAISASLLPPAVNSGVLWALACVYKFFETDDTRYNTIIKTTLYSENQATELAILGSISMCLTIINIICIYVMGIVILKIKEIAPVMPRPRRASWQRDIKIARNLRKTDYSTDQAIMDEFSNLPQEDQKVLGIDYDLLRNMNADDTFYQHTWSPLGMPNFGDRNNDNGYTTVHKLERLYSTIHNQQALRRRPYSLARPIDRISEPLGKTYRHLSDHFPRRSAVSPKEKKEAFPFLSVAFAENSPSHTMGSEESTPTGITSQRRKFIVTPAQEDPLIKTDK